MNNKPMYILLGCEESQAVCLEFRKRGHMAFSCEHYAVKHFQALPQLWQNNGISNFKQIKLSTIMSTATTFTETEQTNVYNSMYNGWTGETRIKIDGKNWVITTSKGHSSISTHCHAVQDEGNGSISFVMAFGSTAESFHVNILRGARATEKTIREAHAEGLRQFYAKRDAGELPKVTEEDKVKIGTVLFTDGNGSARRRAVYAIEGNRYKTVHLDGSMLSTDDYVRPYSKKFGIGVYFKPNDFITLEEINELIPQAKAAMKLQAEQDAIKSEEAKKAADEKKAYLSQFIQADRRTTTAILKRHILATWPSVQIVGIKTDSFSGGDSMDVTYHAPERIEELELFVKSFRYGTFNGMDDSFEYTKDRKEIILEGHIMQSYMFASTHFQQCEAKAIATPTPGAAPTSPTGATVSFNEAKNGIEIKFSSKPSESVLSQIKADGFRWGKYNKVWYIKDTTYNRSKAAKYGILPETGGSGERCGNDFDDMILDQQAAAINA